MNIAELLEEDPILPRIEDERARFYLDNYATIELWASLRNEVAALLGEGLLDLGSVFTADAERLSETVELITNDRQTQVLMRRPDWIGGVGIGVEWAQSLINKQGQVWLFCGLRQERDQVSEENQDRLVEIGRAAQTRLGAPWTKEKTWPVWRWLRPSGDAIDERDLYSLARRQVWRCWEETAAEIALLG